MPVSTLPHAANVRRQTDAAHTSDAQCRMKRPISPPTHALPKAPTGITGFDEATGGGLPLGRTTLLVGGSGTGKTVFALQFLAHGAAACSTSIRIAPCSS